MENCDINPKKRKLDKIQSQLNKEWHDLFKKAKLIEEIKQITKKMKII